MMVDKSYFMLKVLTFLVCYGCQATCVAQRINVDSLFSKLTCIPADLDVIDRNVDAEVSAFDQFWHIADSAKVIVIGELDHRDGSTLALKSELLSAFSERYDSLVFLVEYGVATIDEIDHRIREKKDSVYFHYGYLQGGHPGSSKAFDLIAAQLQRAYDTRPGSIVFGGVDVFEYTEYLELYLKRLLPDTVEVVDKRGRRYSKDDIVDQFTRHWWYKPFADAKEEAVYYNRVNPDVTSGLADLLMKQLPLTRVDADIVLSVKRQAMVRKMWATYPKIKGRYPSPPTLVLRDSIMANNALNFIRRHPNHKVVISVSNFHAAKSMDGIYKKRGGEVRTMMNHLRDSLGGKIASIATVRYNGAAGEWRHDAQNRYQEVLKKRRSSIEALLARRCGSLGFVAFDKYFEDKKFKMNGTFYSSPKHTWRDVYDGIFFIHTMQTDVMVGQRPHRRHLSFPD